MSRKSSDPLAGVLGDALSTFGEWILDERKRRRSTIGVPNAALNLAEILRDKFPLLPEHYTSKNESNMRGLTGKRGDKVISRFMPGMRALGTESGRTSRGILPAVKRLAEAMNSIPGIAQLTTEERGRLADGIQEWIVRGPIREYFEADKLQPEIDARSTTSANIGAILAAATARNQFGQVAQHLVGAKLALRFPKAKIDNFSYSTADAPTGRHGDFLLGSTVFHVTRVLSNPLLRKVRQNLKQGFRVVVLVPEDGRVGAHQILSGESLQDRAAVLGIESFVGQNVDELSGFVQKDVLAQLRQLLEVYNDRVAAAEPDPSLQIEVPVKLGE